MAEFDQMSPGERTIRPEFAHTPEVKEIKRLFTELYDKVVGIATWNESTKKSIESNRLTQKSLDHLETAAMYAVKGLTV